MREISYREYCHISTGFNWMFDCKEKIEKGEETILMGAKDLLEYVEWQDAYSNELAELTIKLDQQREMYEEQEKYIVALQRKIERLKEGGAG